MQFEKSAYTAKEKDGALHIPVIRTGDLSFTSSVRCFTRTMSAMVMDDFEERRNADESRITFLKGEKVEFHSSKRKISSQPTRWKPILTNPSLLSRRRSKTALFTSTTTLCLSRRRSSRCILGRR